MAWVGGNIVWLVSKTKVHILPFTNFTNILDIDNTPELSIVLSCMEYLAFSFLAAQN